MSRRRRKRRRVRNTGNRIIGDNDTTLVVRSEDGTWHPKEVHDVVSDCVRCIPTSPVCVSWVQGHIEPLAALGLRLFKR